MPSITAIRVGWIIKEPSDRFVTRRFIRLATFVGRYINKNSERAIPSTSPITIIKSVSLIPRCFLSHFSVFPSSSSIPRASADTLRVLTLRIIISMKFTTPRRMGMLRNLHFCLTDTNFESLTNIVPSSFLQEVTVLSPAFIITPSSTA